MRKFGVLAATALTTLTLLTGLAKADQWGTPGGSTPGYQSQYDEPEYDQSRRYPHAGQAERRFHEPAPAYETYRVPPQSYATPPVTERYLPPHGRGPHAWHPGHGWHTYHTLPPHRLLRRVERQGYYEARIMGPGRLGAVRVFAYDYRHRPVMLRVDAHSGRVLALRYA